MAGTFENRVTRLEQSIGLPTGPTEIVTEKLILGYTDPIEFDFEKHYQNGALIHDSFAELLNEISGKTRSL